MAGLWNRIKVWITDEEITAIDLNAEFDNVKDNFTPANMDDDSPNLTEYQTTETPGAVGSETLPTNLSEELRQIRAMLDQIIGKSQWYESPVSSIETINGFLGNSSPTNALISGSENANRLHNYLLPDGTSLEAKIDGDPTPLVYKIAGQEYSLVADSLKVMSAGFSSNHTATSTNAYTDIWGEEVEEFIALTAPGSNITGRDGLRSVFTTTNGTTEYFTGVLRNAGTEIHDIKRGFLFDSTGTQGRVAIAGAQTITLLRTSWLFVKIDQTFLETITEPYIQYAEPSGSSGEMWFDIENNIWKVYTTSWVDATATYMGITAQTSGACVAARGLDFFKGYTASCDISLAYQDTANINQIKRGGLVSVYGSSVDFLSFDISWNSVDDMETGAIANSTQYYLYLTDRFAPKISVIKPHDRLVDLKGFYHPAKPWRYIGKVSTDGSAQFLDPVSDAGQSKLAYKSVSYDRLQNPLVLKSGSSGAFTTASATYVDITNLSITVQSKGRPLAIYMVPASGGSAAYAAAGAAITIHVGLDIDGSIVREIALPKVVTDDAPPAGLFYIDAGTDLGERVYKFRAKASAGAGSAGILHMQMNIVEL